MGDLQVEKLNKKRARNRTRLNVLFSQDWLVAKA